MVEQRQMMMLQQLLERQQQAIDRHYPPGLAGPPAGEDRPGAPRGPPAPTGPEPRSPAHPHDCPGEARGGLLLAVMRLASSSARSVPTGTLRRMAARAPRRRPAVP